jgi:hypothetical protein
VATWAAGTRGHMGLCAGPSLLANGPNSFMGRAAAVGEWASSRVDHPPPPADALSRRTHISLFSHTQEIAVMAALLKRRSEPQ